MATGETRLGKQYTRLQLTLDDGTAVMRATAWSRDASSLNTLLEKDTYYDMYNLKFQRKQGFPCELGMTSATMAAPAVVRGLKLYTLHTLNNFLDTRFMHALSFL